MEWLTFLQLRNTSWLVPSYRSVSITHSFHFGQFFSSLGAKAFASLQQYPLQIYRYVIPKNIFFWDNSLSVRTKPLQAEIYLFTFASGIVVRT